MPFEIDHKANEIKAIGSASNINITLKPKGTGDVVMGADININGKKIVDSNAAGATVLDFIATSLNVNYLIVSASDAASPPDIRAAGSDTDIDIEIRPKGTGSIDASSSKIINVDDPTAAQDAATKNYADTTFSLIDTPINAQTGTSYTTVLTDTDKLVTMDNASASTWTVPPNSSVAYDIGTTIAIAQKGAGQVTITPGAGVTLNKPVGLKTVAQWSMASIIKIATDTWIVAGHLEA